MVKYGKYDTRKDKRKLAAISHPFYSSAKHTGFADWSLYCTPLSAQAKEGMAQVGRLCRL
jgi:hypothetical protein